MTPAPIIALTLTGVVLMLLYIQTANPPPGDPRKIAIRWGPHAILAALASIVIATLWFGPVAGPILITAVILHEWGHVIAYRIAGHRDARFRLVPPFGGVAISDQPPRSQLASVYVALMGPGFSLAPLAVLLCASALSSDDTARLTGMAAALVGALNAFNMLPFWPLDGGRALRAIAATVGPRAASNATMAASGALVAFALYSRAWLLLIIAFFGLAALRGAERDERSIPPMRRAETLIAAAAYAAILGAHALAAAPLFTK